MHSFQDQLLDGMMMVCTSQAAVLARMRLLFPPSAQTGDLGAPVRLNFVVYPR